MKHHTTVQLMLVLLLSTGPLLAQSRSAESAFSKKAAAEALFQEGTTHYESGQLAQACEKFEASHALDAALGTTLRLADCFDRIGKSASAWAAFQTAEAMARTEAQTEREEIARERASDLEGRLSRLVISLSESNRTLPGLELMLNEIPIAPGTLGTPVPVDPGKYTLKATAPGYQEWSKSVAVLDGPNTMTVMVPALLPLELAERGAARDMRPTEPSATDSSGHDSDAPQRTWGYVTGGVGLALFGLGGYFAYRAHDLNSESMDHCLAGETAACTPRGKGLRDDAMRHGNIATIAAGAGLAFVGVAAVLLLTADGDDDERLTLSARTTQASTDLVLEGRW